MSHINLLSKEVSELIAAGEVIDRPASVIKELLENSIDAGANVITIEIKNGGRTYIRVTDNGSGISESDISKAFLRHATSKISDKDDLDKIMTLGFRGEALASISAVSKVEVLTKMQNENYGTHYVIEGSEEKITEKSGCPDGTTFIVRDIFYNVPARLKFLKKDTTEANYVAMYVSKLALSHPDISFKFIKDNKTELLTAGDGKLFSGIYAVYGREFANSLIPVEYNYNDINVSGYVIKPLLAKNNRKFQNFFVNGRYIKSLTCGAALEEAYKNNIMVGKFPACVLNIQIAPDIVDVNVHPTKIEVRFSDNKLIYESVFFAVKNALLQFDKPNEIKFENQRNFSDKELYDFNEDTSSQEKQLQFETTYINQPAPVTTASTEMKNVNPAQKAVENSLKPAADDKVIYDSSVKKTSCNFQETVSDSFNDDVHSENRFVKKHEEMESVSPVTQQEDISEYKYIGKNAFEKKETVIVENPVPAKVKPVVIGELFKTYIVAQAGEDMLLFDKHAAHERYIFEQIKNDADQLDTQMYLEPVMVLLSYEEYDALSSNLEKITQLGFAIEPDVAPTVAVMGVPMILGDKNPTEIVTELARNFIECRLNPQLEVFDELFHSIACKAAIKANDNSGIVELQALVNAVYENNNIRYCPHGRPIMIKLSKKDIEKQFKRIV